MPIARTPMPRSVWSIAAAVGATGLLAGCGGESAAESAGIDLADKDRLTVCATQRTGFDVDLLSPVAEDLSVKRKVVVLPAAELASGKPLRSEKCDVVPAAPGSAPHAAKKSARTEPRLSVHHALLARKGAAFRDLDGLKGKKLGVREGSAAGSYAEKRAKGADVITYPNTEDLLAAVENRRIDAALAGYLAVRSYADAHEATRMAAVVDTGERYGYAVAKDNEALAERIDKVLAQAHRKGVDDRLAQKWFGGAADE